MLQPRTIMGCCSLIATWKFCENLMRSSRWQHATSTWQARPNLPDLERTVDTEQCLVKCQVSMSEL